MPQTQIQGMLCLHARICPCLRHPAEPHMRQVMSTLGTCVLGAPQPKPVAGHVPHLTAHSEDLAVRGKRCRMRDVTSSPGILDTALRSLS